MALIEYTESLLQAAIHSHYEGDNDTPDSDDDDYLYRRVLLNSYINRWENDKGTLWNELWTNTTSDSTSADLSIATGDTEYEVPSNFRFPGGYVRVYDGTTEKAVLRVVKPEQWQQYLDSIGGLCYFRGSGASKKLIISSDNATAYNGYTLSYDFYKRATKLDSTDDVPEMSDPYYLVHAVVADLFKQDQLISQQTYHAAEAEERLKQMEIQNQMDSHYQGIFNEDTSGGIMGQ